MAYNSLLGNRLDDLRATTLPGKITKFSLLYSRCSGERGENKGCRWFCGEQQKSEHLQI